MKYNLKINNKFIVQDLKEMGIKPNKTFKDMNIPDIKNNLIIHYIRGFFDGDGSIYKSKRKSKNGFNSGIKFSNTSLPILNYIENLFDFANFRYEVMNTSVENCLMYYMSCQSKGSIKQIMPILYDNATYFLPRKYEKFIEVIN